jgi:outer membrane protein assembly factor BamB
MSTRSLALPTACLLAFAGPLLAADWPQFRGPDRTGKSAEKGLLQSWPKDGPPLLWTYRETGIGFSAPAIVGDRLYILGARGDTSYVLALDVKTGKEVWHKKLGPTFTFKGNQWGDGPRSTPTVDGKVLYALGGYGDLVCLETDTGKEVWRLNLPKDLGGEMMSMWGYCESPLVDGDRLLCAPGGAQGTFAALDKKTGKVLWRSKELTDKATYSSLQIATINGVRQFVGLTYVDDNKGGSATGLKEDGRVLWYAPIFPWQSYCVVCMPVIKGNLVYGSEESGCQALKITGGKDKMEAQPLFTGRTKKALKDVHGGLILLGNHVYGHSKGGAWVCQEIKSGKVAWQDREKLEGQSGSVTYADGRLYLYSDEGVAVLLSPSPEGWNETGRFALPQKSKVTEERATFQHARIWTYPTVANGRLYLRDQELLFCYDIRATK